MNALLNEIQVHIVYGGFLIDTQLRKAHSWKYEGAAIRQTNMAVNNMKIKLKDIEEGLYRARVSQIAEETGPYGPFLRLIFTITAGELKDYRFSGSVRATCIRQSKFCRWVSNIFGQEPEGEFYPGDMIGKECLVCLSRRGRSYFVTDVYVKDGVLINHDE